VKMADHIEFSTAELAKVPKLWADDEIICPKCGEPHIVFGGKDPATGLEIHNVLFYQCGDGVYLAAVDGRDVTYMMPASVKL
jgi:hypothetical protein